MEKISTPLRYPGGKSKAIKFFEKYLPNCKEYREPFLGGGSVFLHYYSNSKAEKYVINDINFGVYSFWYESINNNDSLLKLLRKSHSKKSRDFFNEVLKQRNDGKTLPEANRFFSLNRMTFSGTTESGGYSEQAMENRFTETSLERVSKLKSISFTDVYNLDFEEIIKMKGENVFIYLDPPYYRDEKSRLYGKNGDLHSGFDHERLFEVLSKTKHNWLMTYDNSEFIKKMYSNFYIKNITLNYAMSKNKNKTDNEILISNLPLD